MSKSPEPIILSVALILLALGAASLAYFYPSVDEITGVTTLDPKGSSAKALKADDLAASLSLWNSPVLWSEPDTHHRLFHSDDYLFFPAAYPNGDYIKKVTGDIRTTDGVLVSWYKKYGLDFTDSDIARQDPSGDGFSNIVKFRNDPVGVRQKAFDLDGSKSSNPLDPKSHPEYLSRLRLQKFETRPFHILFNGYQELDGVEVFQLHLNDVPSSNQPPLLKVGDKLGFEGYVVGPFKKVFKDETDPGTNLTHQVDESTLELDKPEIGFKVILPFRKEIDSPEYTADFVMLMPTEVDKVIQVPRGKIFKVPYMPDNSFLVIKVDDNGATIRDTKSQQEFNILKLIDGEWDEVPLSPAAPAATPPVTQ